MLAQPVYAQGIREWGSCVVEGVPTLKCLEVVTGNLLTTASILIIFFLFVMFIVGAFTYLTSFGNAEKVKKAQSTLRYALIGFVVYALSFLLLRIIGTLFLQDPDALFRFEIN